MRLQFLIFAVLVCIVSSSCMQLTKEKTKELKKSELVEVIKLDPTIKLDIRYATKINFLGRPVYKEAKAFLQKPVANALVKVNKKINGDGYGLLIYDGYRPWSVTKIFWDEIEKDKRQFVADPKEGSIHNRGCAVDLTLYELKTGNPVDMPCDYDTFSEEAYPDYKGGINEQRKNRDYLIKAMREEGFTVHNREWWHFNHKDCTLYPILDTPIHEISNKG